MPNRNNLEAVASDAVVDPVSDAVDVKPSHILGTGFLYCGADVRLDEQQVQCGFEILAHCSRSGGTIDGPPFDNALDLATRAARNVKLERHNYS